MSSTAKYIGMDVHKESISIAFRNAAGKIAMESLIEAKANTILDFIDGLRGDDYPRTTTRSNMKSRVRYRAAS